MTRKQFYIMVLVGLLIGWSGAFLGIRAMWLNHQAVRAIVGEAADQGFNGMLAVAEVIRHNGLKGVNGINAKHISKEPKWVWKQAEAAWERSKTSNITRGANHFSGLGSLKKSWTKGMTVTLIYNDQVFYKE